MATNPATNSTQEKNRPYFTEEQISQRTDVISKSKDATGSFDGDRYLARIFLELEYYKRFVKLEHDFRLEEEDIRKEAYEISKLSNATGKPEKDWFVAIEVLKRDHYRDKFLELNYLPLRKFFSRCSRKNDQYFALDAVKAFISAVSTIGTIIAGIGLFVNYQHNNERLITERFSKAIEQLGSDKLEVRLGGIYALERISKDSSKDYWTVMEVLTAFVRERSNSNTDDKASKQTQENQQTSSPTTDIHAVLTILERRSKSYGKGEENRLDLRGTNFRDIDLRDNDFSNADLSRADLSRADLSNAKLSGTKLNGANLDSANLSRADLNGSTNLSSADLSSANLNGAKLWGADLNSAKLWGADLTSADLNSANLSGAQIGCLKKSECTNLTNTKNLTLEQVKSAKNWQKAKYDKDFRIKLGLPPQKPESNKSNN